MSIELKVPSPGESITEVMVGEWLKAEGDFVQQDEPVVVIETDKVNLEIPAPQAGTLAKILKQEGDDAEVGDVVGLLEPGEGAAAGAASQGDKATEAVAAPEPQSPAVAEARSEASSEAASAESGEPRVSPAARHALAEAGLQASQVQATGPGGRLLKEDVLRHTAGSSTAAAAEQPAVAPPPAALAEAGAGRHEEAVKMTPLRRKVAERLLSSQHSTAQLTTFNEVDMSAVMGLRKRYQEAFVKRYGIKVGFMSFFVKAVVEALKAVPQVNAEIRGDQLVYRHYFDIGIAVGGGKGLVVPVVRNAERLSLAEIEQVIADYAQRARANKLKLEELQGGTFTISNGGIYGSLLSTPILNPPQSGILGMHKIEERPVAVDGQVVVRPMMYLALTYDHRLVDGREAVTFLVRVKETLEDPARILLEV